MLILLVLILRQTKIWYKTYNHASETTPTQPTVPIPDPSKHTSFVLASIVLLWEHNTLKQKKAGLLQSARVNVLICMRRRNMQGNKPLSYLSPYLGSCLWHQSDQQSFGWNQTQKTKQWQKKSKNYSSKNKIDTNWKCIQGNQRHLYQKSKARKKKGSEQQINDMWCYCILLVWANNNNRYCCCYCFCLFYF